MTRLQGIIIAILGAIAFGIMPLLARIAYNSGTEAVTVVFLRFFLASVLLLIYFLVWKIDFRVTGKQLIRLAFLGIVCYAGTSITLFLAFQYIPVGLAIALHFVYPSLVAILSFMLYKETLSLLKIIALAMSVAGIYLLIGVEELNVNGAGVILALLSGIFFAVNALEIGRGETGKINNMVVTYYLCLFASLGSLVYGLNRGGLQLAMGSAGWLAVLSLALVSTVFAIAAFSLAVRIIGSSQTAILNTFEPVTGILLGAVVLQEGLTLYMLAGSVLVILAAVLFCIPSGKENAGNLVRQSAGR